jgi:predicted DNA-binding protein
MKRFLTVTAAAFMLLSAEQAAAQDFENPGQYMDYIHKQQDNISKRFMTYTSASAHGKREKKVEALRSKLMDEIQEARMNISGMPGYKGDKSYRDTAVNFMKFYYNVMNEDYAKIVNMEEIAEQSYDDMELYILAEEKVQEKLKEGNARMTEAQKQFAAKNNINLLADKSEMGEMLDEVAGTNKHYHEVYLIFFKPYIQEQHLTEAISKGNITGIEQSKNAMLKYAQEGLTALASLKGYNGDKTLINGCTAMLKFYVKEADKTAGVSDFFLTKERFDGIKKEMDKKSNRTKEDVESYNKAVNDINKASQSYNALNKDLNDQRNDNLKQWNDAVKSYFDEHTPHYK